MLVENEWKIVRSIDDCDYCEVISLSTTFAKDT